MVKLSRTSVGRAWAEVAGRAGSALRLARGFAAGLAAGMEAAFTAALAAFAAGVAARFAAADLVAADFTGADFTAADFTAAGFAAAFGAAGLRAGAAAVLPVFATLLAAAFTAALAGGLEAPAALAVVLAIPYSIVKQTKQYI
jgi:hypothetical protein